MTFHRGNGDITTGRTSTSTIPALFAPIAPSDPQAKMCREFLAMLDKARLLSSTLDRSMASPCDFTGVSRILHTGCGAGQWALDTAFAQPQLQIVGIDSSHTLIDYARAMAGEQGLTNVSFRVIDLHNTLDFSDGAFDLVYCRQLACRLSASVWPGLMDECFRIMRSCGTLLILESDTPLTNVPALQELYALFARAIQQTGCGFPRDDHAPACSDLIQALEPLVHAAGFRDCEQAVYTLDYAYGAAAHDEWRQHSGALMQMARPFLITMGLATSRKLDRLFRETEVQMSLPTFHASWPYLTMRANKP